MKPVNFCTPAMALFALVAASAASTSNAPAAADVGVVDTSAFQSSTSFLGFRPGEERRYVLGPPEALYSGEQAYWSIRLREMIGDPPDGIFELTHQWQHGDTRAELPIGTIVSVESEGELRVNSYGFPLELRFRTKRHLAGWGDEAYAVRYRFEDRRFLKHIAMDGHDLEHVVATLGGPDLDLSVPMGMYALVPTAVDCSYALPPDARRAASFAPPQRSPGSATSPAVPSSPLRFADNSACREQLFANPGLISLMLPVLWEEGSGEHEYLLLTPAGPFGTPGFSGSSLQSGTSSPGGGTNIAAGSEFDHERAVSARANSDTDKLHYIERVRVEVGSRTRDAWLFDGMRALDAVYVDDDGVVLRVDLDMAGWYGISLSGATAEFDPQQADLRDLWVRLLYPSEY